MKGLKDENSDALRWGSPADFMEFRLTSLRNLTDGQIRAININERFLKPDRHPKSGFLAGSIRGIEHATTGYETVVALSKNGDPLAQKIMEETEKRMANPNLGSFFDLWRSIYEANLIQRLLLRKVGETEYNDYLTAGLHRPEDKDNGQQSTEMLRESHAGMGDRSNMPGRGITARPISPNVPGAGPSKRDGICRVESALPP